MSERPALLDTSVLIARETGRPLDPTPEQSAVSVVTIGELQAGVLAAPDTATRARRWAELRVRLAEQGRGAKLNDLWIAAVALANSMDVVTRDDDFDAIAQAGGPEVTRI